MKNKNTKLAAWQESIIYGIAQLLEVPKTEVEKAVANAGEGAFPSFEEGAPIINNLIKFRLSRDGYSSR